MATKPTKKSVDPELFSTDVPPVPTELPPAVPPRKKPTRPARPATTRATESGKAEAPKETPAASATAALLPHSGATATDDRPTAEAGSPWVAVPLRPMQPLARPVSLAQLKADARLSELALLRQSRLSVLPVRPEEFDVILELGAGN